MSWELEGQPLRSILVSRLRYLGDVVMSTPVLETLKAGDPQLRLGYLCEQEHSVVLRDHSCLENLHLLQSGRQSQDARARSSAPVNSVTKSPNHPAKTWWAMTRELRGARYDLAVDLFFNPRSAWLLRLSGIPFRIGGTRGSRRHLFTHCVLRQELDLSQSGFHEVAPGGLGEHLLRLAPLIHQPSGLSFLAWFQEYREKVPVRPTVAQPDFTSQAKVILEDMRLSPGSQTLLLAPGATWRSKEWPLESWIQLVGQLMEKSPVNVLVAVPPGTEDRWGSLSDNIAPGRGGVLPVMGLGLLMQIMTRCDQVVSVDGGLMHTAVGLGKPTVGLFGPTRPDVWFPYTTAGPYQVLATQPDCHPCNLHDCDAFICLPELSVEKVWNTLGL